MSCSMCQGCMAGAMPRRAQRDGSSDWTNSRVPKTPRTDFAAHSRKCLCHYIPELNRLIKKVYDFARYQP